jgi:hypothetical protein
VGGILHLEHVNFTVPGQDLITVFFINGLGLTRDPYKRTDETNFGVNVGQQQFHLPSGGATAPFPGLVHFVSPDRDMIVARLRRLEQAGKFEGTPFQLEEAPDALNIVSPYGPRLRVVAPGDIYPKLLGIHRVDLPIPAGAAEGCAAFYREIHGAPATVETVDGRTAAVVTMGPYQKVVFYEDRPEGFEFDYRTFHIAFYITNFNRTGERLEAAGAVKGKVGAKMFFSTRIFDPGNGETLFLLENEVRSISHPDFMRQLVNRWPLVVEPFTDQFQSRVDFQASLGFKPGAPVPAPA